MPFFHYQHGDLQVEEVSVSAIAKQYGTPCYIYSKAALTTNWLDFDRAMTTIPHRICYAVKANSNLAILKVLASLGSGFDIVSQGELERVLAAGGDPANIVFSGVGKKPLEMERALEVGIACFNVESEPELERLQQVAEKMQRTARIALRVNPNIDAGTHPYIATGLYENKFGIDIQDALALCHKITTMPHIKLIGIACHIGSQLTELAPFLEAIDCLDPLLRQLANEHIQLEHINIGGGLGVRYQHETLPSIHDYVTALTSKLKKYGLDIIFEPGRAIVANTGILLTEVQYIKQTQHKKFAIVDAAMNDLLRPALYSAWQNIIPVQQRENVHTAIYDIVGPVCESADFLGKDRELHIVAGDLLAICTAGAYGSSMSSNYNSRPRVAEIMVDKAETQLIRRRESIADLLSLEV